MLHIKAFVSRGLAAIFTLGLVGAIFTAFVEWKDIAAERTLCDLLLFLEFIQKVVEETKAEIIKRQSTVFDSRVKRVQLGDVLS